MSEFTNKFILTSKFELNKSFLLTGIFILLSCNVFGQDRIWKTFTPPTGEWSILAPGILKPDAEAQEPGSLMGSYSYNDSDGFFAVVYRDNSKTAKTFMQPFIGSYYKKVSKGFVKSSKGKLLKELKFTNGDVSGREVWIQMPQGTDLTAENQVKVRYRVQRMRMFFHASRFYLLLVILPENEIDGPSANDFFNYFALK